jgi:hypothetical protein
MRLRRSKIRRYIWADAVCINQDDHPETLDQMKLMREIYSTANRVLVWLGEDIDNEAKQSFDRLKRITLSNYDELPPPKDSWWKPVAALYRCEWFTRLWVFQEIAMATSAHVYWGAARVPWEDISLASMRIRTLHLQAIMHHAMFNVYNAYLFHKWSNTVKDCQESFLYMLQVTRKLQCSVRRDRVNALLGFATVDMSMDDFEVKPGERTRSVYQRFARKMLRRMRTLDLLSAIQHESPVLWRPTWVPRWNTCLVNTLAPLGSKASRYTASQHLPLPSIKWKGNRGRILRTLGIEFDSIVEVKQEMASIQKPCEMAAAFVDVLTQLFTKASPYPTGESLDQVGCFTLTAGLDAYGMIEKSVSRHLANFAAFWADYGHAIPQLPCADDIPGGNADSFLMAAGFASGGRRLFHTATGYVGIGPTLSQRGDIVCVLAGGAVPFVVRRDSSRPRRRFELIGEAYVHGIMHGEATSRGILGKQMTVDFNIV